MLRSLVASPRFRTAARWTLRLFMTALVTFGVVYSLWGSWDEFQKRPFPVAEIRWGWLALSGALYALGLGPSLLFWRRTLWAMGQRPTFWECLRAFYLSQLGKYAPIKAVVVMLRMTAVHSERTERAPAAISVFVETLTLMAVGAILSAGWLALLFREQTQLLLLSLAAAAAAGVPMAPPVLRRIIGLLQVRRVSGNIDAALRGLTWRLMGEGAALCVLGWAVLALSMYVNLMALPGVEESWRDFPLAWASVGLAVTLGFVSLLPGGVGVRELVIVGLLAPRFGAPTAWAAGLTLRVSWLLTEMVISTILYGFRATAGKKGEAPITQHE